jgi:hypothetical protein
MALVELVPSGRAVAIVGTALREQLREDFSTALALPLLKGTSYEDFSVGGIRPSVRIIAGQQRYAGGGIADVGLAAYQVVPEPFLTAAERAAAAQEPAADFVEREALTAREEIIRDWVNGVQQAWRGWGREAGRLELDADRCELVPPVEPSSAYELWKEVGERSRASLLASIALGEAGVNELLGELGQALRKRCKREPVALPGGLMVGKGDLALVIRAESAAAVAGGMAEMT